jgi:hypothetical protein
MPDAKVLRDMVEHIDDYESGSGRRQDRWTSAWPRKEIVGPQGQRIAAGAISTTGPGATIVLVEGDATAPRVTTLLGGRLDVSAARRAAGEALDVVTAELDRVRIAPKHPAQGGKP